MNRNKFLIDISIIRPICIFLLVVYHAFIIYQGGWEQPAGFRPIIAYWWISKASYAFMLELFVFISGYVFALTLQKRETSFKQILISKLKRLLIPSIIFSIAYYFMFLYTGKFHVLNFIKTILSGAGHMWFLPMLFWVTLLCYAIDRMKYIPNWLKITGVGGLPILSILPIPFQINVALYYSLFFYLGILIFRKRTYIIFHFCNNLRPTILWGGGILHSIYRRNYIYQRYYRFLYIRWFVGCKKCCSYYSKICNDHICFKRDSLHLSLDKLFHFR